MLTVEFNGEASRKAIRAAIEQLQDMTALYQDIGEYMIAATRQRFVTGQDPEGKAWAPKSQGTLDRYKAMGYGNLSRPLIGPGKALSRQIVMFVAREGVVIGSSLIYAGVMQRGAAKGAFGTDSRGNSLPWGTIPARRWLGISAADESAIVEIVEEALARDLEGE